MFKQVQNRLLRVLDNPQTTAEEAERTLRKIGAQAARIYQERHEAKSAGFTLDIKPKLTGRPSTDERLWWLAYCQLVVHVANQFADCPGSDVIGSPQVKRRPTSTNDVIVKAVTYPPDRWQERIEDHVAVMGALHEMSCSATKPMGKDAETTTPPDRPTRAVSLTHAAKHWFGNCHLRTLQKEIDSGKIVAIRQSPKRWTFDLDDVIRRNPTTDADADPTLYSG